MGVNFMYYAVPLYCLTTRQNPQRPRSLGRRVFKVGLFKGSRGRVVAMLSIETIDERSKREHLSFAKRIFIIIVRAPQELAYCTRERGRSHYKCKTEMLPIQNTSPKKPVKSGSSVLVVLKC